MNDARTIAILLATLNGAAHLREQLDSYRAQSWTGWRLVVSDDGSADDTLPMVDAFAATCGHDVTRHAGPRLGFWQNFISLAHIASDADLFAFSDQDDVWHPDKLARAARWHAGRDDRPALYCSRTTLIDAHGRRLGLSPRFARPPGFANALVQNIGGGNTMVFNRRARDLLAAVGIDSPVVSHDWTTYQLVSGAGGDVVYDPRPSLDYRQHAGNVVGANAGAAARLARLRRFAGGGLQGWNRVNLALLAAHRDRLSAGNRARLDAYARATQASGLAAACWLWRARVYRQSLLETAVLYAGALTRRL